MSGKRHAQDLLAELLALTEEVQNRSHFTSAEPDESSDALPFNADGPNSPSACENPGLTQNRNHASAAADKVRLPEHCVIPHQQLKTPQIARPAKLSINLRQRNNLKQAIIMAEILDRPRAYDL